MFKDKTHGKRVIREISLLRQLKHPCLCRMIDVIVPDDIQRFDTLYVILEYAESDIRKYCKSDLQLTDKHVKTLMYNMFLGLKYMHSLKVVHRDLKPANILLNQDCSIKICDFGLSRSLDGVNDQTENILKRHKMKYL